MPLIDVDLPEGLIPTAQHERLVRGLGFALLEAEGLPTEGPILEHAAVYIHTLPVDSIHVLAGPAVPPPVRIRVTTAAGSFDRAAQRQVVGEMTRIIAEVVGEPAIAARTFVLLSEIAEGGWGSGGTALGRQDLDALNATL